MPIASAHTRRRQASIAVLAAAIAIAAFTGSAFAAPSPTIAPGSLNAGTVHAGVTVDLGTLVVSNAGDSAGVVTMGVTSFAGQSQLAPPASWLTFTPASVGTLAAGASTSVDVELTVPGGSAVGAYRGLLTASISPPAGGIGTTVATVLTFTLAEATHTVTVVLAGTGGGGVTSSPVGINCGADCSEAFDAGTDVTLTATAAAGPTGSIFTGWSGDCTGTNPMTTVTISAAKDCTATFTLAYTLTVTKSGDGTGTVVSDEPNTGISCGAGSDCAKLFASGTSVSLTATAGSGSTRGSWSGCSTSSAATISVTVDAAKTCTISFTVTPAPAPVPTPTPTPAPTPAPTATPVAGAPLAPNAGQKLPPGVTVGTPVVNLKANVQTQAPVDTTTGKPTVSAAAPDRAVSIKVPVGALPAGTLDVAITIAPLAQTTVDTVAPPPVGAKAVVGRVFDVAVANQDGDAIDTFAEPIDLTFEVDPAEYDVETIAVFFWDPDSGDWMQVPAIVLPDGTVQVQTEHLTVYAIFTLPTVSQALRTGLNTVTFTGASGTSLASVAGRIGQGVVSISRFNLSTQRYDVYIPGAPPSVQRLQTLDQRDAVFLLMSATGPRTWTTTDMPPTRSGSRVIALAPGLTSFSFTGASGMPVPQLLTLATNRVVSVSRWDAATQSWRTYIPGAPAIVNSLATLNRLDVVFVRLETGAPFGFLVFAE